MLKINLIRVKYKCGVSQGCKTLEKQKRSLTDELLDLAELSNKSALERFRTCCISGVWPTGYEDLRIIDTL